MQRTSAPVTNPVLELHDQSRADGSGAQPLWLKSGGRGPISPSNLPRDVILGFLDEIRAVGSLTTSESTAERPVVRPGHLECRTSLLNVCLSSRALYGLAIPRIYRNSLVKDRRELLHFFRKLVKQADRRPMVRSFAWAGVLWEADADAGSSIHSLEDEATIAADFWNSIKDEWPRNRVDYDIAKVSEYEFPDTDCTCCSAPEAPANWPHPQGQPLSQPIVPASSFQWLSSSISGILKHSTDFVQVKTAFTSLSLKYLEALYCVTRALYL